MLPINIDVKYVYRYKVCTNFYGPAPMYTETMSVVASNSDDALRFIHGLYKRSDNLYSVEFLDKTECVLL